MAAAKPRGGGAARGAALDLGLRDGGLRGRDLPALIGFDAGEDVAHGNPAQAFEALTRRSRVALAAPLSRARERAVDALAQVRRLVGDDEGGGGVEQRDVAIGRARAVEHGAQLRRVVLRIAALEVLRAWPAARPTSSGVTVKRRIAPFSSATTMRSGRWWSSRRARRSRARSRPARSRAPSEPASSGSSQASENTPRSWRLTPAGLDSGPSRLKSVRVPSSTRTGATWRMAA